MKYIDYRDKLGIGFADDEKGKILASKISVLFQKGDILIAYGLKDYYHFFLLTGSVYEPYNVAAAFIKVFENKNDIREILALYIAFIDSMSSKTARRQEAKAYLLEFLDDLHIPYEIMYDGEEFIVLPKGACELDSALVTDVFKWLDAFPRARKSYTIALRQYQDMIYARDVADNLRKTLETFLQEYLGNNSNLEKNKNLLFKKLGAQKVCPEFASIVTSITNTYKEINDKYVKHNDAMDQRLLEFLLYQTGLLMRAVITIN